MNIRIALLGILFTAAATQCAFWTPGHLYVKLDPTSNVSVKISGYTLENWHAPVIGWQGASFDKTPAEQIFKPGEQVEVKRCDDRSPGGNHSYFQIYLNHVNVQGTGEFEGVKQGFSIPIGWIKTASPIVMVKAFSYAATNHPLSNQKIEASITGKLAEGVPFDDAARQKALNEWYDEIMRKFASMPNKDAQTTLQDRNTAFANARISTSVAKRVVNTWRDSNEPLTRADLDTLKDAPAAQFEKMVRAIRLETVTYVVSGTVTTMHPAELKISARLDKDGMSDTDLTDGKMPTDHNLNTYAPL